MTARSSAVTPPVSPGRRALRRQGTKAEIIAAAWELVRENGLASLSMRELGDRVGMKAQSIYSYYGSKHEIYDAMFHEGYLAFAEAEELAAEADGDDGDPREEVHRYARRFFEFCTSDPVRYQLLFQRTIPDFVPSAESYAVALAVYESMTNRVAEVGGADAASIDLWTATLTGLTDQQISNDPGGDRWERILDRAVDMVLRELAPHLFESTTEGTA